ncbi:MAG: alpha/beta hydrolase [Fimbriimonadaceae bacterium]|nr:alpha/beta hydrolase [Fimbriimonadaceae bacterium]
MAQSWRAARVRLRTWRDQHWIGGELALRCYGDPAAPRKLLLLHGVGLTAATWRQVAPALAELGEVVAVDLNGHGASRADRGSPTGLGAQAALIPALLDALRWRQATLVGHSMGGGAAIGAALLAPRRVAALVLVGSAALPQRLPALFWPFFLPGADLALTLLVRAICRLHGSRWLSSGYGYDPVAAREYLAAFSHLAVCRAVCRAVQDLRPSHYLRFPLRFPQITTPTLILHGERDDIVPPEVPRRLAALLPQAELRWIRRGHHIPQETHPGEVTAAIRDFLNRDRPVASG